MIDGKDLLIDIVDKLQGRGGMRVSFDGDAGVKITHVPTGTIAIVTTSRSQHINRVIAMDMIESAITHPRFR